MRSGFITYMIRSTTMVAVVLLASLPATADAPAGRYHIASGEVVDTETGLIWQQTSSDSAMSWEEALKYCSRETWRVPSMKELQTLVDETRMTPAMDTSAFADVLDAFGNDYWSSSRVAGLPSYAWLIRFDTGRTDFDDQIRKYRVRCVR